MKLEFELVIDQKEVVKILIRKLAHLAQLFWKDILSLKYSATPSSLRAI